MHLSLFWFPCSRFGLKHGDFRHTPGQKAIVIGEKGAKLKKIGMDARIDMEKMFEQKIMLTLWVKVKGGWSDDERALKSLGYSDI